jgi:Tetracyclin repressor-like, C-terminal domain
LTALTDDAFKALLLHRRQDFRRRGFQDGGVVYQSSTSLPGKQAPQRAALITAYLLGLAIARDVLGVGALANSADEALLALVAPVIQTYIDDAGLGARTRKPRARTTSMTRR